MEPSLKSELKLLPVDGVRLATAAAGIKKSSNEDLLLIEIAENAQVAAVFTANRFAAAPVELCRQYLQQARPRYLLINSGNANCGLGAPGLEAARLCCEAVASAAGVDLESVLPFSTGVIAEPLPAQKIVAAVPDLIKNLDSDQWIAGAEAIRTTDTVAKGGPRVIDIDGVPVTITGICKGSGMIRPNMATMLAYIATDAVVAAEILQPLLNRAVDASFNCISVDGDMSTNDACLLIATGKAGNPLLEPAMPEPWHRFEQAVTELCTELAQLIVRDGEGATKFITIQVRGTVSNDDARAVAIAVAHSPLVKTAFFASDANWGRILAAVGYAPIENLDISKVEIFLGDVCIVRNGARADQYEEAAGAAVMAEGDITLTIDLHSGDGRIDFWTCDLSYDYVRINAEYRT
ncbi:MAG: bifunctional glutamate N-acetyltransferase/amino-acid acetyltransferase ArgJ [Immundisolibacteraceae bacterium]|nr:bifunctional glutamate N-acetyltransferase/amino-acid acetyltransferase ArgJ [Immundisolibacteraceae bacterium]